MRIHSFHHVPFEGLASIEDWAINRGHTLTATKFYDAQPLPQIEEIDWLIVMGGPMNIYEENKYPWLVAEKDFIKQAIDRQKPVLGICLGAQLIADVLGAKVTRNPFVEIGWFPIQLTEAALNSPLFNFLPSQFPVLHWHGDTFELPPGAVHIAASAGCQNQAFTYGERVVGLQFHLELTPQSLQAILANSGDEITPDRYVQTAGDMLAPAENFAAINQAMAGILDSMAALPVL